MVNPRKPQIAWERLQSLRTNWHPRVLTGLTVIALVLLARALGVLQPLEWKTLDIFLRWRPAEKQDDRVLIVGINEADIQRVGAYPIPDGDLAALLQTLAQENPRVIGIDILRDLPVEPGHETLVNLLETSPNIFGIEKIAGDPIPSAPALPPERVGFLDFPLDQDGFVRRAYLGAHPSALGVDPSAHPDADRFRFSLALKLAEAYLAHTGLVLDNGRKNPHNMRFGDTELFQFQPNSGGYINTQSAGLQILITPRSGKLPFDQVTMTDVLTGQVDSELIRDRIILIGITSLSTKDLVNSAAVNTSNPSLFYGVEMQAHITSQILSAVLDNRPMLAVWEDGWEYLWIILWGSLGMLLVCYIPRPSWYMLSTALIGLGIVVVSFTLLWLGGWWIPVTPTLLVFTVNGWVLPGFYFYDQMLRSRIDERQFVIKQTYDAIHNGPLQILALLLQQQEHLDSSVSAKLENLNQELRSIYDYLFQESRPQKELLYLGNKHVIGLKNPLHKVLYEVYNETLRRDFPGFCSIKFHLTKFEPLQVEELSIADRRSLCRFLEEALCNVGKHADSPKRLTVLCLATESENVIRVEDNGALAKPLSLEKTGGRGTQQAIALARKLHGTFQRSSTATSTYCELRWPFCLSKPWWRW